jgi:cyclase
VNRTIIVARIAPGAEPAVAEIFKNSDATALPHEIGVERRSLYSLGDLYVHSIDFRLEPAEALRRARGLREFQTISSDLRPYISPYDEAQWRSPEDALAREFYRWSSTD